MKRIFYLFFIAAIFFACNSSKYYLAQHDVDNALFEAVDALAEKATNAGATQALPILYRNAQKKHLGNIEVLQKSKGLERWNKILSTYEILQELNDAITGCPAAAKLVQPVNYQSDIEKARQMAAEESYQLAENFLKAGTKKNMFTAYEYYKLAIGFAPDYKDAAQKMDAAFDNSTLHVLVRPFTQPSSLQSPAQTYVDMRGTFQNSKNALLADLESNVSSEFPIKFYTQLRSTDNDRTPDCIVDVRLNYFNLDRPTTEATTNERIENVLQYYDTNRNPIYQTVRAVVTTWKTSVSANLSINVDVNEFTTGQSLANKTFKESHTWKNEFANYQGDDMAITNNDSRMAAGLGHSVGFPGSGPSAMAQLYTKIYPRLMTYIQQELKNHLKKKGFLSE